MEQKSKFNLKSMIIKVTSVIFYLLIVALLIFSVATYEVKENDDVAHLLGLGFLSVETNEMSESFNEGDLIFIKLLDEKSMDLLSIGNIITYYDEPNQQFVSHRIYSIYVENGIEYIQTKADDSLLLDNPIKKDQVIGIYQSTFINMGHSLDYLQSPKGFLLFVVIPVIVLLTCECIMFIIGLVNYNKSKFNAKFEIKYKNALKHLESETKKIRNQILSNWIH
ncbi:MAG: signal peptidase I [Acholeplasmataceae bacterium]|nr:signal peptidase I [Acholeplasmataceae bacterium]